MVTTGALRVVENGAAWAAAPPGRALPQLEKSAGVAATHAACRLLGWSWYGQIQFPGGVALAVGQIGKVFDAGRDAALLLLALPGAAGQQSGKK